MTLVTGKTPHTGLTQTDSQNENNHVPAPHLRWSRPDSCFADPHEIEFREQRIDHWDEVAQNRKSQYKAGSFYQRRLAKTYRFLIPEGSRVIELGCGTGNLLASLKPSHGVGIDFSGQMISSARAQHPELTFVETDLQDFETDEKFDFVILSDLVNDLFDVQAIFEELRRLCKPETRVILNLHSRAWHLPLAVARKLKLADRAQDPNWLTPHDVINLLKLSGFEVVRNWSEILCPLRIPGLDSLCNRFLVKTWPFRHAAFSNFVVARPKVEYDQRIANPKVSVIVPARNEEGNVNAIFDRIPEMAGGTEIIFIEGGSQDQTYEAAKEAIAARPHLNCQLLRQTGKGKGDAVRLGFSHAQGDILMILDADLTVPPEDLPRFVEALRSGTGEFVNGVRLVYPMQDEAMRFLNLLGNKFFSMAFSWLLDQSVKDTLCGTKVLWKKDYECIADNRSYFGDFDPYGDFDLIFGAAKQNMKIVDLPVRYRARTYGTTNINRWTGGALLLRMTLFAARRLKFV